MVYQYGPDAFTRRREAAMSEMADTSRRVQLTVDVVEAFTRDLEAAAESLSLQRTEQEIDPGLGKVVVDGDGVLVDVQLDPRAIRTSDIAALGQRIMAAIQIAEGRVNETRARLIRDVSAAAHL